MEQVTGFCIVKVNGVSIRSKEGAKLNMGGFERTPIIADNTVIGYVAKPVASMITATLAHTSSSDLAALRDLVDATIVFETDSGVRYTQRNAFSTKPPELTGGEGDVAVEFAGAPVQ